jgi:hypothetical protein
MRDGLLFRRWLEYFGYKYGKATVAVPPHNTSQNPVLTVVRGAEISINQDSYLSSLQLCRG